MSSKQGGRAGVRRAAFKLILMASLLPVAAQAQLVSYVDASDREQLKGTFDVSLGGAEAGLDADMLIMSRDGATRFTPRLTTHFAPGSRLAISAALKAGDLNREGVNTTLDTSIAIRPALQFVDRIETSLRQGGNRERQALKLRFADLDTGFEFFGGRPLGLSADMEHERSGERMVTTSNLTSRFGLGRALSLQSDLRFDDDAGIGIERSLLETRLVYRTPFAAIKTIEGELRRRADGDRQSLAVTLSEIARELGGGSSYRLSGKALIREIAPANGVESRRIGFETRVSGLFASPVGGRNSLKIDLERGLGSEDLRSASLSYNHEWTPTEQAHIELEFETRRRGDVIEPAMDITWSARF